MIVAGIVDFVSILIIVVFASLSAFFLVGLFVARLALNC